MTPTITLTAPTGVAVMPMRRVIGAYLTEARYENHAFAAHRRYSPCRFRPFPLCCICSSLSWSAPASAPIDPRNPADPAGDRLQRDGVMGPGSSASVSRLRWSATRD